jgi:hypothetical protein
MSFAPYIFVAAVINHLMAGKLTVLVHLAIPLCAISHDRAFAGDVGPHDRNSVGQGGAMKVEAACDSAALDKGENGIAIGQRPPARCFGIP